MNNDMVTRVAIAISGAPFPSKASVLKAKKAMEAMRNPTDAMIEAFYGNVEVRREGTIHRFTEGYQAMIDKAMSDY